MRRWTGRVMAACLLSATGTAVRAAGPGPIDFSAIPGPIILQGDERIAFRDPAAHYHDGVFRVFHTLCRRGEDGRYYWYLGVTRSRDLVHWTEPRTLTPRDPSRNFSSPGNIVRRGDRWVICLQTYPTPNQETFGTADSRIWTMTSDDLESWSEPELIRVKGPDVPIEEMGRMIDPYLLEDKDRPGRWWCFYKQRGMSMSFSDDGMRTWTYHGRTDCGENVCVLAEGGRYLVVHSPGNGIGFKASPDLVEFRDLRTTYLGQGHWPWARGRLTAGQVLDLRAEPRVGRYLMFFHGESEAGRRQRLAFGRASLALAWSNDLENWDWPGKGGEPQTGTLLRSN